MNREETQPTVDGDVEQGVGTVFVVKEDEEYCFLFKRDNPGGLYSALFDCAGRNDLGLSRGEALEIVEGIIPETLRSI